MSKVNRILLLYISFLSTISFVLLVFFLRGEASTNARIFSKISSLEENITQTNSIKAAIDPASAHLNEIKSEIDKNIGKNSTISAQTTETVLPDTQGFVTINDKQYQSINIYQEKTYASKILSKATFDKTYRYTVKDGNWYKIIITGTDTQGWVSGTYFKTINEVTP